MMMMKNRTSESKLMNRVQHTYIMEHSAMKTGQIKLDDGCYEDWSGQAR